MYFIFIYIYNLYIYIIKVIIYICNVRKGRPKGQSNIWNGRKGRPTGQSNLRRLYIYIYMLYIYIIYIIYIYIYIYIYISISLSVALSSCSSLYSAISHTCFPSINHYSHHLSLSVYSYTYSTCNIRLHDRLQPVKCCEPLKALPGLYHVNESKMHIQL